MLRIAILAIFLLIGLSINKRNIKEIAENELNQVDARVVSRYLLKTQSKKNIEYIAHYRILFKKMVIRAIQLSDKTDNLLAIMFIDLDNFKPVNSILGYEEGDKLLGNVAQRLKETIGETGEVARFSGDEFMIRFRGMIPPGIFIPLAEENGLINSIGKWVLKTACIQNKKWQDMNLPALRIGVNLSSIQLIDVNIVNFIKSVLCETSLNPKYLELEITESMTIEGMDYIDKVLEALTCMGIGIALDDFGTEHSSFSRLKTLPIDRIKIDMQFIQGIEKSKQDRMITMMMINLAKGLNVNIIAEGVESQGQLDFLKEKQCDDVQGYYYYKPMPLEEFEKLLLKINIVNKS